MNVDCCSVYFIATGRNGLSRTKLFAGCRLRDCGCRLTVDQKQGAGWTPGEAGGGINKLTVSRVRPVSQFRRGAPQYLAAVIKNLLLVDLGMVIAFPTIVIPPLKNATEGLHFTKHEASWFGSIVFLCQPFGSLIAAVSLESLGRKRSMICLNIPFLIGWTAMYFVNSVTLLFVLTGLMGLAIGSIEAAILTYVGEISEPRLRGTLTSFAQIAEYIGFVFMFFLGTVTDWRTSALISAAVPVLTIVFLTQVPETPIWLLSRGRRDDAVQALCWLRGWVEPDQVQSEFEEIVRYSKTCTIPPRMLKRLEEERSVSNAYINDAFLYNNNGSTMEIQDNDNGSTMEIQDNGNGNETDSHSNKRKDSRPNNNPDSFEDNLAHVKVPLKENIIDFCRPEMMKPMFLVTSFFFFLYGSGTWGIRPYTVSVFLELGFQLDPFLATTVFTVIGLVGSIICSVTVRWVGKRPLALISVVGCFVGSLLTACYTLYIKQLGGTGHSWIPMVLMVVWFFFTGIGMDPLPWMYLSEVFPFRGRSFACGVAAAISYVFGFIATKTFLILEESLSLAGVFFLYTGFNTVAVVYFYYCLPETEGLSMQDIEDSYKNKHSTQNV